VVINKYDTKEGGLGYDLGWSNGLEQSNLQTKQYQLQVFENEIFRQVSGPTKSMGDFTISTLHLAQLWQPNHRVEYSRTLLRSLSRDQRIRDSLSGKTY
jgi:hypothetical protein